MGLLSNKMVMLGAVAVVVILILAAVLVISPAPTNTPAPFGSTPTPITMTTGSFTPQGGTQVVSTSGGTVAVTNPSSPINGVRIDLPSGAADESISVDVSYADVTDVQGLPPEASVAGKMINIQTSGSADWNEFKAFDEPVIVTLPYDTSSLNPGEVVRYYSYDEDTDVLSSAGFLDIDENAGTVTFMTRTFSKFVAVKLAMEASEMLGVDAGYDTGFRPKTDGFFIPNAGSYINPGGNCMGMSSFARYYYMNEKAGDGTGLYNKYREGNADQWTDDAIAIELATRAHTAENDIWSKTKGEELYENTPTSREVGLSWIHGMLVTGSPQLVGLYQLMPDGKKLGGHAVMTYRYENGAFDIYDPNHPGTEAGTSARQIDFTLADGFKYVYSSGTTSGSGTYSYNMFMHWGYKAFHPIATFADLYDFAEKGFKDDTKFPTIILLDAHTSPSGDTPSDSDSDGIRDTTETTTIIEASIVGGSKPVEGALLFVSGQRFEVPVDTSGHFKQEVPLFQGDNPIVIMATDKPYKSWAGYYSDVISSTASKTSLTLTLTWDTGETDVDLHVMEPTLDGVDGRHIYYNNKGSAGTGNPYQDLDDRNGFGPEHYYASDEMTLPNYVGGGKSLYGEYQFRVHYYADHDDDWEEFQTLSWYARADYLAFVDQTTKQEHWQSYSWSGSLSSAGGSTGSNFYTSGAAWSSIFTLDYPAPDPLMYNLPPPPQNTMP